jgi:Cytochrome c oxidase subunit IV
MRNEFRVFTLLAGFLYLVCGVYAWWTWYDSGPENRVEWIGTLALFLTGLLCLMCGGYFWFVSRRIAPRPEDRSDADIADGAGEVGFFSPGSYYPFGVGAATTAAALGLVFWMPWLIAVGLAAVLVGAAGLLFEYYTGARRSAEH